MCWPKWMRRGSGLRTSSPVSSSCTSPWIRFTRRISGELRVPGGDVWERVSAGEALAIACGDVAVVPVSASVLAA